MGDVGGGVTGAGGSIGGPATVNVTAALTPVLPAVSPCAARAAYVPTANGAVVALNAAEASSRVAVSVVTGVPVAAPPVYTETVTVVLSPAPVPATPVNTAGAVVVVVAPAGPLNVMTGAVESSRYVAAAEHADTLPAASVAVARTAVVLSSITISASPLDPERRGGPTRDRVATASPRSRTT